MPSWLSPELFFPQAGINSSGARENEGEMGQVKGHEDHVGQVRRKEPEKWFSHFCVIRLVELLYVDTGVTDYADVRSICVQTPPMLCSIPQQALQCLLAGIKLVG